MSISCPHVCDSFAHSSLFPYISRGKLAVVDENSNLLVYNLATQDLLFQETNANSVAWNTELEVRRRSCSMTLVPVSLVTHMLLNGILTNLPPSLPLSLRAGHVVFQRQQHAQHQGRQLPSAPAEDTGIRRGVQGCAPILCLSPSPSLSPLASSHLCALSPGSRIFCLHIYAMQAIDVPQSASLYRYLEKKDFVNAFKIACLGVTDSDWRLLAVEALTGMVRACVLCVFVSFFHLACAFRIWRLRARRSSVCVTCASLSC